MSCSSRKQQRAPVSRLLFLLPSPIVLQITGPWRVKRKCQYQRRVTTQVAVILIRMKCVAFYQKAGVWWSPCHAHPKARTSEAQQRKATLSM